MRYTVRLTNVKSFRKEGRKFIKLLEGIDGATNVKRLSFGGGRLEVELYYPSDRQPSDLEGAIFDASEGERAFKKLDIKLTQGRQLNFTL